MLASLGGTPELAAELVAAGLWKRTRQGYVFHDWLDWGSKRTAEEIRELRKVRAENGRKGGVASGKARSKPEAKTKQLASQLPRGGLNPISMSTSVVDVSDQSSRRNARGDPVIDEIIKAIYAATSRVIDEAWAAKIRDHILGNHSAANPAAYVRKVIENDPDPHTRFLEHYGGNP
ncbi:MAG TPA: hypothetical protein VNH17_10125 [Streptosporangiaceae bacterium]|nr:hypothetical protein [Streptosporangiaceae bacterium]